MKRNIVTNTVVAIVFALALVSLVPSAHGQQCSLALAAGKYGFTDSGTVVGIGPRAANAVLTLDSAGNIGGPVTASLNGSVTHSTLSGTYTVNRDCTGTASFSEVDQSGNAITATVDFIWVDNMREILFIFTSATLANGTPLGTVINGNARKLVP